MVASGETLLATDALTIALPLDALLAVAPVAPVAVLLSLEPPHAVRM
jgi:hypothetical protein